MQSIVTSQHLTQGTLALPTYSHGTPNWHHDVTSEVGIGGCNHSGSRENTTKAALPNPMKKWGC